MSEKTLWPILDQNDSSNKDAKDLLARDCSFVPYFDTKNSENDVYLLMIFNPKTMQASSFKVESAESNDNFKGFRLIKEDGSFSAVLPECTSQDKVLGVSLIDSKNKKWKGKNEINKKWDALGERISSCLYIPLTDARYNLGLFVDVWTSSIFASV